MKIGIITFHWATNYGAILQTFALQQYLKKCGCDVSIINYKPSKFDDSIYNFVRQRKFFRIKQYLIDKLKEYRMQRFRETYLCLTRRYKTQRSLTKHTNAYDIVISGSDQVMNPSFLQNGESGGSKAYFLDFVSRNTKRVAYAVSFGVTQYPQHLCPIIKDLLSQFSLVSTREKTGASIVNHLGLPLPKVVPDPTLLLNTSDYTVLLQEQKVLKPYYFVYIIHNRKDFIRNLKKTYRSLNLLFSNSEKIEYWLNNIRYSRGLITNSFHGLVFSLHFHVPFVIVLSSKENTGMNDRFYTLLAELDLLDRLVTETDFTDDIFNYKFDWNSIDERLQEYRKVGQDFINDVLSLK